MAMAMATSRSNSHATGCQLEMTCFLRPPGSSAAHAGIGTALAAAPARSRRAPAACLARTAHARQEHVSASRVRIEASASIAAVVLSLVAGTSSCGGEGEETGGEGEGGALCRGGVARLHECGVVTNGYFACVEPTTAEDDCMLSCVADADCDDLRMLTCAGLRRALDAPGLVLTHAIGLAESWSPALENCRYGGASDRPTASAICVR